MKITREEAQKLWAAIDWGPEITLHWPDGSLQPQDQLPNTEVLTVFDQVETDPGIAIQRWP